MSDKLVLEIFKNFEKDFKEYHNAKSGRIRKYFDQVGVPVKNAKPFKMKLHNHKAIGEKKNSRLHGKVIIEFGKKNYYIGDYKNNQKNGHGYHHFNNGLVYIGKYENDKKIGGIVIDPESGKRVYEGDWGFDGYHGNGKLTRRSGVYYQGPFNKGLFEGQGEMHWPNGDRYVGNFANGFRCGYGKFFYDKGDTYIGEFKNNVFHGNGTYTWAEGDEYKGHFENGRMTGEGKMQYSIGILGSGVWDNKGNNIKYELTNLPPSMQNIPRN